MFSENPVVFNGALRIVIIKWYGEYDGPGYYSLTIKSNRKELSGWILESYISRHDRVGIKFCMTNGEIYKIKLNKNQIELYDQCIATTGPLVDWEWV